MNVVFIDLHAEDLRVTFDVVPLGVRLQRLLDVGVFQPGGEFRRVDQVVDDALKGERRRDIDDRQGKRWVSDDWADLDTP